MSSHPQSELVLIIEDDDALRDTLVTAFRLEGLDVAEAADGPEGIEAAERLLPNLVILDILLPTIHGHEVCRRLRARFPTLPVLMLTVRDEVAERVAGLNAGADDYLAKPFDLTELMARVRALLRRSQAVAAQTLRVGELRIDRLQRTASRGDRVLDLTDVEFRLLETLMLSAERPCSRSMLHQEVWGIGFETGSRTLDVHISNLREKTEAGGMRRMIQTVRGVGFVLRQ